MRRFFIASLLCFVLTVTSGFGFAESAIIFDIEAADNGVVRVKLDDKYQDDTIKIMVALEGQKPEFYDYDRFEEFESYGMTAGEGTYQIGIYQNTSGNSYRSIGLQTVTVDDVDPLLPYLNSVQNIRWNAEDESSALALQLTKGLDTDWEKVKAIHQYIIENISYDYDKAKNVTYGYLPSNDLTLETKDGICYDYSSLMASMLRSLQIPTKLVMGYENAKDVYHAWNEVYDESRGEWILIDSTFDASLYQHGYAVEMERDHSAYRVEKVY